MYYVYILLRSDNKLYTGKSSNLKKRMLKHQKGNVRSTKLYLPVRLIYYETYNNKTDAHNRELYLKSGDGRQGLRKQLKRTLHGLIV